MHRILLALALLMLLPPTLAAQESEALRSYPAELVLGLLSAKAGDLTVGVVPAEAAQKLPLPPGAKILGSLHSHGATRIVADVKGTGSEVEEAYGKLLESRGWDRLQEPQQRGLLSESQNQGWMYCAEDGVFVSFNAGPDSDHSTRLSVRLMAGRGDSPCFHQQGSRHPMDEAPFPALDPPDGARAQGSGSSRSPGSTEQTIRLTSDLPLAEILGHYATQLRAAGWTELDYCEQSSLALQTWRVEQASGESWEGILTVFRVGAEAEARNVSLRLSRQDGEWE